MTSLLSAMLVFVATGDSLRTEVVFLGDIPASRATALWERVIGPEPEAFIVPGKSPDMLVVKDTPERLTRFRSLLKALAGTAPDEHIYVRPVVHMAPSALVDLLMEVLVEPNGTGPRLVPDDRSGRLVVVTTAARYRAIDKIARTLDTPPRGRERRVIGVEPEPEGGLP